LPLRSRLPVDLTWQLELLYKDQTAFEQAFENLKEKVTDFSATYNGKLTDQTLLLSSLADYAEINELLYYISAYGSLAFETDKLNDVFESNMNRLEDLYE